MKKWISDFFHSHSLTRSLHFCSANCWWIFFRISRQIPENSDVCRFSNQICEYKLENCRKFWNMWKIIHYFSLFFIRVLNCATQCWSGRRGRHHVGWVRGGWEYTAMSARSGTTCAICSVHTCGTDQSCQMYAYFMHYKMCISANVHMCIRVLSQ